MWVLNVFLLTFQISFISFATVSNKQLFDSLSNNTILSNTFILLKFIVLSFIFLLDFFFKMWFISFSTSFWSSLGTFLEFQNSFNYPKCIFLWDTSICYWQNFHCIAIAFLHLNPLHKLISSHLLVFIVDGPLIFDGLHRNTFYLTNLLYLNSLTVSSIFHLFFPFQNFGVYTFLSLSVLL